MTMLDDLAAAVVAGGVTRVYKIGKVPPSPTYPYAVIGLGSPDKVARTGDGSAASLDQFTVQFFGRDIDGVLDVAGKGDLDGQFVGGRLVERILNTGPYRDPDDSGVLAILHTYNA